MVVDPFELTDDPGLKAFPVDIAIQLHASTGSHIVEFVVLLLQSAETAFYLDAVAFDVHLLLVNETAVRHPGAVIIMGNDEDYRRGKR